MVAHITLRTYFDLLKAFGYIERVVKSDFFSEKTYFKIYVRIVNEQPSNIRSMLLTCLTARAGVARAAGAHVRLYTFTLYTVNPRLYYLFTKVNVLSAPKFTPNLYCICLRKKNQEKA